MEYTPPLLAQIYERMQETIMSLASQFESNEGTICSRQEDSRFASLLDSAIGWVGCKPRQRWDLRQGMPTQRILPQYGIFYNEATPFSVVELEVSREMPISTSELRDELDSALQDARAKIASISKGWTEEEKDETSEYLWFTKPMTGARQATTYRCLIKMTPETIRANISERQATLHLKLHREDRQIFESHFGGISVE